MTPTICEFCRNLVPPPALQHPGNYRQKRSPRYLNYGTSKLHAPHSPQILSESGSLIYRQRLVYVSCHCHGELIVCACSAIAEMLNRSTLVECSSTALIPLSATYAPTPTSILVMMSLAETSSLAALSVAWGILSAVGRADEGAAAYNDGGGNAGGCPATEANMLEIFCWCFKIGGPLVSAWQK